MPILYGKEKTEEEVKQFVHEHYQEVLDNKAGRYYYNLSLIEGENLHILDYGCGWGFYAIELSEKGHRVTGIDFQNEIDIAKIAWGDLKNVEFTAQKISELPENHFDVVISSQVIEHTHNPGNYLHQINRVLKPNGKLVVSVPNLINPRFILPLFSPNFFNNIKEKNRKTLNNYQKPVDHIQAWDPTHFALLLGACGFEVEKYIPSGGIPLPMRGPFPNYIRNFISRMAIFKSFSYTMHFRCNKAKYVKIENED